MEVVKNVVVVAHYEKLLVFPKPLQGSPNLAF